MTFAEAMAELANGKAVRAVSWGPRRAIRLMLAPWNGTEEAVGVFDRTDPAGIAPYPYCLKGADVRDTWEVTEYVAA